MSYELKDIKIINSTLHNYLMSYEIYYGNASFSISSYEVTKLLSSSIGEIMNKFKTNYRQLTILDIVPIYSNMVPPPYRIGYGSHYPYAVYALKVYFRKIVTIIERDKRV